MCRRAPACQKPIKLQAGLSLEETKNATGALCTAIFWWVEMTATMTGVNKWRSDGQERDASVWRRERVCFLYRTFCFLPFSSCATSGKVCSRLARALGIEVAVWSSWDSEDASEAASASCEGGAADFCSNSKYAWSVVRKSWARCIATESPSQLSHLLVTCIIWHVCWCENMQNMLMDDLTSKGSCSWMLQVYVMRTAYSCDGHVCHQGKLR